MINIQNLTDYLADAKTTLGLIKGVKEVPPIKLRDHSELAERLTT